MSPADGAHHGLTERRGEDAAISEVAEQSPPRALQGAMLAWSGLTMARIRTAATTYKGQDVRKWRALCYGREPGWVLGVQVTLDQAFPDALHALLAFVMWRCRL